MCVCVCSLQPASLYGVAWFRRWWGTSPAEAFVAAVLADSIAGAAHGAAPRTCIDPTFLALRDAALAHRRFQDLQVALQEFWDAAMAGLRVAEIPGCGQGLLVTDTT